MKKEILKQINYVFWILSNEQIQQDVWVEGKYENRIFSFDEAVNTIFDDYNFDNILKNEWNDYNLSADLKNKLEGFLRMLLNFDDSGMAVKEMMLHPDWKRIVEKAKEVHADLDKHLKTMI